MNPAFCKTQLVAAHRAGDGEAMRYWSQVKEKIKARVRQRCTRCAAAMARVNISGLCRDCLNFVRHHGNKLTGRQ